MYFKIKVSHECSEVVIVYSRGSEGGGFGLDEKKNRDLSV